MLPGIDAGTLAQIAVFIASITQILKGAVPEGPNQNTVMRGISILLGLIAVPAYVLSRTGVEVNPQLIVDAIFAGISLGAGTTLAAAAAIAVNQPTVQATPSVEPPKIILPTETPPVA